MHQKLLQNKSYHRMLVKRRSSTVEPVLGTLINHHNLKRLNSRGMVQANKHILMAALCYNLKKYLKFTRKNPQIIALKMSFKKEMLGSLKHRLNRLQHLRYKLS
ncbi:transposase [Moheibacter stercoris]|uniref:transposase n=1 Tax=Moheibacter stercoris TaxID=1628251 RepID=UPI0033993C7E